MKWISVKEELPEYYQNGYSKECLCYSDALLGRYFISRYNYDNENWGFEKGHDAQYNPISHWMPLPEEPI